MVPIETVEKKSFTLTTPLEQLRGANARADKARQSQDRVTLWLTMAATPTSVEPATTTSAVKASASSATVKIATTTKTAASPGVDTAMEAATEAWRPSTAPDSNGRVVHADASTRCGEWGDRPRVTLERANPAPPKPIHRQGAVNPVKAIEASEMGMGQPAPAAPGTVPPVTKAQPSPWIRIVPEPCVGLPAPAIIWRVIPVAVWSQIVVNFVIVSERGCDNVGRSRSCQRRLNGWGGRWQLAHSGIFPQRFVVFDHLRGQASRNPRFLQTNDVIRSQVESGRGILDVSSHDLFGNS